MQLNVPVTPQVGAYGATSPRHKRRSACSRVSAQADSVRPWWSYSTSRSHHSASHGRTGRGVGARSPRSAPSPGWVCAPAPLQARAHSPVLSNTPRRPHSYSPSSSATRQYVPLCSVPRGRPPLPSTARGVPPDPDAAIPPWHGHLSEQAWGKDRLRFSEHTPHVLPVQTVIVKPRRAMPSARLDTGASRAGL
jgi:hypothetical protein